MSFKDDAVHMLSRMFYLSRSAADLKLDGL
jgi:hypothetical protein